MKEILKNKFVVITGCSSGIGKAAAEVLSDRGYSVIATVRKHDDAKGLVLNDHSHTIVMDLASEASISHGVVQIKEIAGSSLYALFNNGAYGQPGAVEDLSRDTLRKQFETNVFGTHQLTCELLPLLLEQDRAHIVQCSSVLGFIGMPMRGAYVASKYALEGLSDTMRMELHDTNVQLSLIEPGPILSHFRQNALLALRENIDFSASRHGWRYVAALARLEKEGAVSSYTLGPEAVVAKLLHALEAPKARARYYVTRPTYIMGFLKRVAPSSFVDKILLKYAKGE